MYGNWASGGIEQPERMRWWQPEEVNLGLTRLTMQALSLLSLRASNCPFLTAFVSVSCTVLRCARRARPYTAVTRSHAVHTQWLWDPGDYGGAGDGLLFVFIVLQPRAPWIANRSGRCQLADGVVSARIDPVIRGVLTKPGYPTRQQNKQGHRDWHYTTRECIEWGRRSRGLVRRE